MPHKFPRGLYALIDDGLRVECPCLQKAEAALQGGAPLLQLRLHAHSDRAALDVIGRVMALARPSGAKVIINDRVDLALVGHADGVHLGAEDLPLAVARRLLGPHALLGATTRTLDDIIQAQRQGADYVGLGPIFPTHTKVVACAPLGLHNFADITRRAPLPVVGIAGITLATVGSVARAGATAVAVARDFLDARDMPARARALHQAFLDAS